MSENLWLKKLAEDPGHSEWYVQRFEQLAAAGQDLHGEARMIDAMVPRGSRILDAGCGQGRLGGRLAQLGHWVVGVDLDPVLIAAAEREHPNVTWLVGDLAELDLGSRGLPTIFDVAVSAGNVMTFLAPSTRRTVLRRLSAHLAANGRLVVGFGSGRGYLFEDFFADAAAVELQVDLRLSSWDLRPFTTDSNFLVAVLRR